MVPPRSPQSPLQIPNIQQQMVASYPAEKQPWHSLAAQMALMLSKYSVLFTSYSRSTLPIRPR